MLPLYPICSIIGVLIEEKYVKSVFVITSDIVEEQGGGLFGSPVFRSVEGVHGTFESGMKEMERLRDEYAGAAEHMEVEMHVSGETWAAFRCWDDSYFEMKKTDVK
jgi:hypothetical protein